MLRGKGVVFGCTLAIQIPYLAAHSSKLIAIS